MIPKYIGAKLIALSLCLHLSTGLSAASSASDWLSSLIEQGRNFFESRIGQCSLASSASLAGSYAIQEYRASRPVTPPHLVTFTGTPCEEGVATLFVHGFGGDRNHACVYTHILPGTIYSFNFSDAEASCMSALPHTGLGQPVEVEHLKNALRQLGDQEEVKKIIVFGISRGGATVANLIKESDIPHLEKISGFIVEQSFGKVRDILQDKLQAMKIEWMPGSMILAETVMKGIYYQYSSANQPVDNPEAATAEAKQKQILITCSEQDALIPHTSTESLSHAFAEGGFTNVRHITFPYGQHAGLPFQGSRREYIHAMHSFIQQALETPQPE